MKEKILSKDICNDCTDCRWKGKCNSYIFKNGEKKDCLYTVPVSSCRNTFDWFLKLKKDNIPSSKQRLTNTYLKSKYIQEDSIESSYELYVNFINNSLSQVRLGQSVVVFTKDQLKELLRFEPTLNICECDRMYYIWLPKLENILLEAI